jgi:hypothetical protein
MELWSLEPQKFGLIENVVGTSGLKVTRASPATGIEVCGLLPQQ